MNNLRFENEILQETFKDCYSRVRVQEENLKSMDKKIYCYRWARHIKNRLQNSATGHS
ncbi:hypothetical protein LEP1GSC191_1153 [Leptospira borgpetersenii serovar Mini str. 201000851]|uniref:Uncharacterized protein n=4 Tax=Leptospira borgpetersenii TaxID=174 RepID=M3GRX7_LEPBO|nr:hypothetical protein LEP1GSC128_0165 [Leptospira borgpetersenii str. 200801926]EMF97563.1 hypothetical protein LEP1GSC123_1595 [Leptospira borgpetersenii str. 200701203]EMN11804.1 hypothetical protein LEP1GSC055_1920 [Leptospira borgpetersenii str. Brem 307]EMN18884.1 hypothetical protein LEP1GSC056_1104 [Leptospira borgpetersenii str. Brem 328]ENO61911.1 hypothetical protein LEP1GSC191_1153 [Leptospira borgpetersenii serovar Mini str. 201000851]